MKNLQNIIIEKLHLHKSAHSQLINNVDTSVLKYFTKKDVDRIINWINTKMPINLRPSVISNTHHNVDNPSTTLFLFYVDDYDDISKYNNLFDLSYIAFEYNSDGLSINIYNSKTETYSQSKEYPSTKDLDKCFDYIERKYDVIENICEN